MSKHNNPNNEKKPNSRGRRADMSNFDDAAAIGIDLAPQEDVPVERGLPTVNTDEDVTAVEHVDAPDTIETTVGIVTNCKRLNIRKAPNEDAEVAYVVDAGTKLTIGIANSNNKWCSVITESDGECFCMKKYVDLKR